MQNRKMLCRLVLTGLLALGTCSAATLAEAADAALHVDQVGYLTDYSKVALVADPAATSFEIVDASNNQVVFKGSLSAAKKDALSEETLRQADFSALKKPGTYKLGVGTRESYDFVIGDNVYAVPAVETWRSYTLSRSNTPINDPVTGLKIKDGHPQDRAAQVWFTDALNKKGDKIDVSGGWYDAGDYGKYITTAGISSAQLLLAYEAHPDHFTRGQLLFPPGVSTDAKLPDALTEVKFELDWMRKMQRKDGSTFHKVAGTKWPGFDVSPDTDRQDRYLFGNATSSSAMYGASLAIGARVYAPFDKAYAQTLKKDAVRVWSWLQKNPDPIYRWDDGQESGSGPYDKKTDLEERIWLAAELFRTTGDKTYENYLAKAARKRITEKPSFFTWDNTLALGQFAYLQAKHADPVLRAEVKKAFLSYADDICQKIAGDGFHCALAPSEYTWASTKNALTQGDILLMANQIEPKQAYVEGALAQIHYLFGRNSLNKSFMTGMGDNPPEHPHNRIHESTGAYVPGLVVGGPNHVSGGDPDQTKYLASGHIPVAKSYLDVLTSWSTNEYAIDYTATAAYALAWFASPEQLTAAQLQLTRKFPSITTGK